MHAVSGSRPQMLSAGLSCAVWGRPVAKTKFPRRPKPAESAPFVHS